MILIEIIAVISTLWCVWLTREQSILSWPVGMVGIIAYFVVFMDATLYADMTLQVLFMVQSIYGWYNWYQPKTKPLPVIKLTDENFAFSTAIVLIGSLGLGTFLDWYTDSTLPYIDAIATNLSLLANWYLTRKIIQSWHLWIAVDVILICTFLVKGLYLSAALYFILLILAMSGLVSWRKDLRPI